MKRSLLLLILPYGFSFVLQAGAALPNEAEHPASLSLNGTWEVYAASADQPLATSTLADKSPSLWNWMKVEIPGHLKIQHPDYLKNFSSNPVEYYRKIFRLPGGWQNRRIAAQFDGVLSAFQVWVDGAPVGQNDVPLLPSSFEITRALSGDGEHVLAMRVLPRETPGANGLTGIFREVSLLALPDCAIDCIQVSTEIEEKTSSAKLHVQAALMDRRASPDSSAISLSVELFDPQGNSVTQTTITWFEKKENFLTGQAILPIPAPVFWTAETPVLYQLTAILTVPNQSEHRATQSVGVRAISTSKGVLSLNGTPIHLRGIVYRESHPAVGFALQESHWQDDLQNMKNANLNAIRLASRPPHPRFLQLCDELGFYVIYDLPVSGDESADILAESLVRRDSSHPCILAWNLNGQSAWNPFLEEAAKRIKTLDSSRPLLAAGLGDPALPAALDILAPNDPSLEELEKLAGQKRPIIALSHSPSRGNALEGIEDFSNRTHLQKNLAGGMLDRFTDDAEFESGGNELSSESGILKADRTPKLGFWQARKVNSPVWIEESEAKVKPGNQTIELTLHNDFDFTNFRELSGQWFLLRDGQSILAKPLLVNLDPGKRMQLAATVNIPDDLIDRDYSLQYQFADRSGRLIYEHSVRLRHADWQKDFVMRLRDLKWDKGWNVTADPLRAEIKHRDFSFIIQLATPGWFMRTQERNVRLITGGPFLRVGNTIPSASGTITPALIRNLLIDAKKMEKIGPNIELQTHMMEIAQEPPGEPAQAQVDILSSPFGYSDIRFSIQTPENRPVQELGLGFLVPPTLNEIVWLGKGPSPSYPGQSALCSWGLYLFNPLAQIAPGNRAQVDLLSLRDERGFGIGLMLYEGDVSIEPGNEGTLITINSIVAGLGNGNRPTFYPLSEEQKSGRSVAAFRLVPLVRGKYPAIFERLWVKNK